MATTRAIELKTPVPGPRTREVLDRLAASVASPLAITFPVVASEARGVTITDVDGNTFIDFAGGVGCLNVGHSHPHVVAAAQEQLDRFSHTDFTVVPYEVVRDARRAPAGAARPFTGAGEGRVLQRRHRGRRERRQVRARLHRPPGRDRLRGRVPRPDAALAHPHLEGAPVQGGPRPVRARGLPRAVPERLPRPVTPPTRWQSLEQRVHDAGRAGERRRDRVRAGAGRGRVHPRADASSSRACARSATSTASSSSSTRCRPGFARTGRFFAIEHYGVEPDLITVAKSIAMGLPLSGVLGKAEIMDAPVDGGVGGTYVGNPVAQAAALAVLDVIEDEGLVERSAAIGETIRARMVAWQERWPADRRRARARRDARDRARRRRRQGARRRTLRLAVVDGGAERGACCS